MQAPCLENSAASRPAYLSSSLTEEEGSSVEAMT